MPTHYWGDEDFDWGSLNDAIEYIDRKFRLWRINVRQTKEKWGELRCYCNLGLLMFHQIIWPGYVFNQYPYKWMWKLDINLSWLWRILNLIVLPIHIRVYRYYHKKATKKWPHIKAEILGCPDYPELLKGL